MKNSKNKLTDFFTKTKSTIKKFSELKAPLPSSGQILISSWNINGINAISSRNQIQ